MAFMVLVIPCKETFAFVSPIDEQESIDSQLELKSRLVSHEKTLARYSSFTQKALTL